MISASSETPNCSFEMFSKIIASALFIKSDSKTDVFDIPAFIKNESKKIYKNDKMQPLTEWKKRPLASNVLFVRHNFYA
jgi:hypothetical protein